MKMKKLFASAFLITLAVTQTAMYANAQQTPPSVPDVQVTETINREAVIYMFSRETCSHCQDMLEFLEEELPDTTLEKLDIDTDPQNMQLFNEVATHFGVQKGTPLTTIGSTVISGFGDGTRIVQALESSNAFPNPQELMSDPCGHVYAGPVQNPDSCPTVPVTANSAGSGEGAAICEDGTACAAPIGADPLAGIKAVPFLGKLVSSDYSLPTLSAILGIIDGFNPCAMWVLVIFLIALVQIGDRFKMAMVAGTFLLAEGIMYAAILVVWFNAFEFVQWGWINTVVGVIAIGAGLFFLYEGIFTDGTCKVTNVKQRQKISARIQGIAKNPWSWGMFLAILGIAFSVNIIEFACSAGIPQAFTLILSQSALTTAETTLMMTIYILGYMFDDLVVFSIALYSIEKIGITHKFSKVTNIIGGVLMITLGVILAFMPELLTF
jgi:hypothetical protein